MTRLIKQINFPADLRKFKKDQLKQIFNTVAAEIGAKNKQPNEAGFDFNPQLSVYRFTDNNSGAENNLIFKLLIEKAFSKIISFKLKFEADIANTQFNTTQINNNLFSLINFFLKINESSIFP